MSASHAVTHPGIVGVSSTLEVVAGAVIIMGALLYWNRKDWHVWVAVLLTILVVVVVLNTPKIGPPVSSYLTHVSNGFLGR